MKKCANTRGTTFVYVILPIDTLSTDKSNYVKVLENKDNDNKKKDFTIMSSKEQIDSNFPCNNNDMNLMKYMDSVCSEIFSPWVPKLLMEVFILTQHHEDYSIIKLF